MRGLIARALEGIESLRANWIAESPPALPERLTPLRPPAVEMISVPRADLERWHTALAECAVAFGPAERHRAYTLQRDAIDDARRAWIDIRDVILLDSIRASLDEDKEPRA